MPGRTTLNAVAIAYCCRCTCHLLHKLNAESKVELLVSPNTMAFEKVRPRSFLFGLEGNCVQDICTLMLNRGMIERHTSQLCRDDGAQIGHGVVLHEPTWCFGKPDRER